MRLLKNKGFTLIELLVVITLIGILAVAVLSALNPIEQLNKGRDAKKRADSSQTVNAFDRYFASNEKFPWNNFATTPGADVDVAYGGPIDWIGFGICSSDVDGSTGDTGSITGAGTGGCTYSMGHLISTQELKKQFGKRTYFEATAADTDKLWVYKAADDPSVSVCFVPASKATRDTWDDTGTALKKLTFAGGAVTNIEPWPLADTPVWSAIATAPFVCIPEE